MSARVQNHITGRLSLRPPQAESLSRLARALDAAPELLGHERDVASILSTLKAEFATLEDFEREFPSLCFALATGVGKTRLMGAFIAYLHLAHGINNFFVLAPNLTIYNKLITDFTRNTPKYVFKGIAEFAQQPPLIITGDNYDQTGAAVDDQPQGFAHDVRVNIFNISKINSEVRGGKEPRIKRMREVLGDSYFNHLANLPDLVLLMDESYRYRASAGVRAINELRPLFGLEVTATPFVESGKGPVPFKNVVMDYPLARAMEDGFVKEPAVVIHPTTGTSCWQKPAQRGSVCSSSPLPTRRKAWLLRRRALSDAPPPGSTAGASRCGCSRRPADRVGRRASNRLRAVFLRPRRARSPPLQQSPTTTDRPQTRVGKGSGLKNARETTRENGEQGGVGEAVNAGVGGVTLARPCPESAPTLGDGHKKTNREGLVF